MILVWIILILMAGGVAAWVAARWSALQARVISLIALAIAFVMILMQWLMLREQAPAAGSPWLVEFQQPWIPQFGIGFHFAMDGLSLLLVVLTLFIGLISVIISWTEIDERVGFYHFNLMWILAGITGVFVALDLFLFYFFWEVMLIPMYFLISIWGHENRTYAAIKFFIFTQASGLLMLLSILGLYFIHGRATGVYSFDYAQLLGTPLAPKTAMWLMLGFFVAFAVKLPAVPIHSWLPDAHTEAPTAGSVILAALLLKTGAYGLIRFVIPFFPQACAQFAPVALWIAVIGILYGAMMSFAQTDLKRLVAYTSVSHMGFVLLGLFAFTARGLNELALQGAVMEMVCHALSTGALFILVGALYERIHTRRIDRMGGLWPAVPRMGAVGLFFALASLGLPGMGNFIAEMLVLFGVYPAGALVTTLATLGLVGATVYSLWFVQVVFFGPPREKWRLPDLGLREMAVMAVMMAVLIWLGLYPRPVLATARPALVRVQQAATAPPPAPPPPAAPAVPAATPAPAVPAAPGAPAPAPAIPAPGGAR